MANYLLSPAARRDIQAIWRYTAQQWGVEKADRYADILADAIADLAKAPKIAPACDHIHVGFRRGGVEQHMIYYRITADGITVVRVLHTRMDARRYL